MRAFIHERLKSARAENELRKVDSSDLVNRVRGIDKGGWNGTRKELQAMDLISRNSYLEARVQQLEADHNKKLVGFSFLYFHFLILDFSHSRLAAPYILPFSFIPS